jgi:hypothetical protein
MGDIDKEIINYLITDEELEQMLRSATTSASICAAGRSSFEDGLKLYNDNEATIKNIIDEWKKRNERMGNKLRVVIR